ncbi:MAG TPA: hypothetical protein VN428_02735, partial [Bryobacteraceae bacterium]|nr:hypothetical protein [Bryobacteraceae bacterium]
MRLLPLMLFMSASSAFGQGFTATVSGATSVHVGYSTYVSVMPTFTDAPGSINWVNFEAPPGITGTMITRFKRPEGTLYAWYGPEVAVGPFEVQISAAASVAPGTYPISIVTQRHGIEVRLPYSITVKAVETALLVPDAPPVLALAKWESTFRTLGAKWCKADETMLFGYEGQVWYYDGGRVYLQMADHFKDKSWESCAYNILGQYRDLILSQGYWSTGWRVFTKGLRMAYERTGDPRYKEAIHILATKSPYAGSGGRLEDSFMRETAYILQAYVDDELVGNGRHPNMMRAVTYLIAQFDATFETGNFIYHQTFMDGLGAEALIDYYELTKDPRIPSVIRSMLDWTWDKGWDKTRNKLVYNPEPLGPRCNVADGGCQVYTTNMINLVVPTFAWYWSITGDSTIRERGDIIFSHALDSEIDYGGKIFSQNYRWSPRFVGWRSSGTIAPVTHPDMVILSSPADGATDQLVDGSLYWNAAAQADAYDVYLGTSSSPPLYRANVSGLSLSLSGLAKNAVYYWKVVARNSGGSTSSPQWSFSTVNLLAPGDVILSSPADGATDQLVDGSLYWNAAAQADAYDVY